MTKCAITHEKCGADDAGFWDNGDSCPIQKYKHSSYYYDPGESKSGSKVLMDDTCRFYGIARAEKLKNKKFLEG